MKKTLEENSYENCEIIDYDIVRYYNEKTAAGVITENGGETVLTENERRLAHNCY